ncbi:C40 family peptidase [Cupriavidus numazuensis]|uniref:Peptidase C51 domain-containing protein n=1 Tax=Cupriavidus numazuensis TaxID=221992 RepID=A0ABN7Q549_9BURK|nr:hypothetical protein [Cupriavidus numazuensis]CAG2154723.1 hypothetical protein LMG26411_04698 [Cupriavidus numazuensis]
MNRRDFLAGGTSFCVSLSLTGNSFAQTTQGEDVDYVDYVASPPQAYQPYGTSPPLAAQIEKSKKLMEKAPEATTPSDVLKYYETLQDRNEHGELYNAAWANEWNPVIVEFYHSTSLPKAQIYSQGDTIAWCAACLNYVLNRLGKQSTGNAMSGSFRLGKGLGSETETPKIGEDIIVFKRSTGVDVGHGHVGIYMGETDAHYLVLGGNQKAGKRYSSINTTRIPKIGAGLKLASFRSFASIPNRRS